MRRSSSANHARRVKIGFGLGLALFVIGAGGSLLGGQVAPFERTAFLFAEEAGIVLGLFSPFVFGVLLPLIE